MTDSPPSLQELRDRFATRDPSPDELAALRADPRKGAQQLAKKLVRRKDAAEAWVRRVEELSRPRKNLEAKGYTAVGGVDEASTAGEASRPTIFSQKTRDRRDNRLR